MKKHISKIVVSLVAIFVIFLVFQIFSIPVNELEIEYQTRLPYLPNVFEYHYITSEVAVSIAKVVWRDVFGRHALILKRIYFHLDRDENAWIVRTMPKLPVGDGELYIMIDRDTGEIMRVWRG